MKPEFSAGRLCLNMVIWLAALLWLLPILVALWVAVHPAADQGSFSLWAPLTLQNFTDAGTPRPLAAIS